MDQTVATRETGSHEQVSDATNNTQTPVAEELATSNSISLNNHRKRKKKVEIACVYCRRSHMICDESRPCQRCIKRGIGHLCYDEPANSRQRRKAAALRDDKTTAGPSSPQLSQQLPLPPPSIKESPGASILASPGVQNIKPKPNSVLSQTFRYNQEPLFYSEHAGSEFSLLNDFLSMIDDPELVNGALNGDMTWGNGLTGDFDLQPQIQPQVNQQQLPPQQQTQQSVQQGNINSILGFSPTQPQNAEFEDRFVKPANPYTEKDTVSGHSSQHKPVISDSARDKFFLTAADPTTEISPEERLKQVIKAKLEAGLLQPYHYAKGYARLQNYMDNYMNVSSRQRILKPLLIFRPAFRAIARTLKDVDLVLVEENFERMLLDYDRVFTSMAIPACLWRRTGEIYRGNKEFALLVGVTTDDLKDGKLAIYELMSEESAVNFWEKYGAIAFDKGQKAVLTSCNLRTKDGIKRKSCCFSFTIRRDRYNIPSCIVGNFIPIDP